MTYSQESLVRGEIVLISKPLGWTSFQVVNKLSWAIRKRFGLKKLKVGHAGTLDPLATGLLIICTGGFTKRVETYQNQSKIYTGTITLGSTTPSYDLETQADATYPTAHITHANIHEAAQSFIGEIAQYPPVFSAVKKDGKRLYEYARKQQNVEIPARMVNIASFSITAVQMPNINFTVECSKGTYIRTLAHDFGKQLQSGAHLSSLCRTQIGAYKLEDALSLETFIAALE